MRRIIDAQANETQIKWKAWRTRIFTTVWITYMIYYLGRVNIGIATPFIIVEFGISTGVFGAIGMTFFILYAFGQFFNGQMGDKFGSRRIIYIGLIVSSIINMIIWNFFGIIWVIFLLWGLNGFFQSMGWGPSVKTVANWTPPKDRGRKSGTLGMSYMVGGAVSWGLATFLIVTLGLDWRYSFGVAGIIMFIMAIHWYVRGRGAPEEVGLPTLEEEGAGKTVMGECRPDEHLGFRYTLRTCFFNKTILFASFGLFCLNIVRYGITQWLPYIMASEVITSDFFPLWKTIAFPIGGIIGAFFCTWFSDRFLGRKRIPIISTFFIALAASLYVYTLIPPLDWVIGVPLLVLIGFLTFGPHALLVSTIPMEFGTRKAAASATGFIDGWGYVGSALTTLLSGILIGASGPESTFLFWMIVALAGGIVLAFNWKSLPEKKEYF